MKAGLGGGWWRGAGGAMLRWLSCGAFATVRVAFHNYLLEITQAPGIMRMHSDALAEMRFCKQFHKVKVQFYI